MFKDEFIRLLAKRVGLSLADTKYVWSEVETIIKECIEKREPLDIRGVGHIDYILLPVRKGFDLIKNETIELPEAERLSFRFSRNLKDMLIADPTKRRIYQTRQAELRRAGLLDDNESDNEEPDENEEMI